jgi:hypothetical protein
MAEEPANRMGALLPGRQFTWVVCFGQSVEFAVDGVAFGIQIGEGAEVLARGRLDCDG